MTSFRSRKPSGESNADKLRDLLNGNATSDQHNQSATEYLKSKCIFGSDGVPALDDLVRLIQTTENVNQQLLFENKFLADEKNEMRSQNLKLIQENGMLHKELKNCTVMEILNEINNIGGESMLGTGKNKNLETQIKSKNEELQKSQNLINELQHRLQQETSNNRGTIREGTGAFRSNTLNSQDISPMCCTKCTEELEIKIRQIENLKNDNEALIKSKNFLRSKVDESEIKEADLISQVKKYVDLVKHIEQEKDQAVMEKDHYAQEKLNSDKKIEEFLKEFQENLIKEKQLIVANVDDQIEKANAVVKELEEKCFKQEALIDKLTRDKIQVVSEMESYKKKCNSIDLDTHQMAEKLRIKYQDVLKERDGVLYELKRVRHDYDAHVKDTDQDMFCMRNELSTTRNRLLETEKDTITARDQCIALVEEIERLKAQLISLKHTKETMENTRTDNNKEITEKYQNRESQLASGIEALQARYCTTVKELEDLIDLQKKHITKLKSECKTLNEQLGILAVKYKNDVTYLNDTSSELATRLEKYKDRTDELESQSVKHNELHDKMKIRLKEMTLRMQEQNQDFEAVKSNEALMKSTNLQLMQELESTKKQLNMFTMPKKFLGTETRMSSKPMKHEPLMSLQPLASSRSNGPLETARSAIEESIMSIRSKIAV